MNAVSLADLERARVIHDRAMAAAGQSEQLRPATVKVEEETAMLRERLEDLDDLQFLQDNDLNRNPFGGLRQNGGIGGIAKRAGNAAATRVVMEHIAQHEIVVSRAWRD